MVLQANLAPIFDMYGCFSIRYTDSSSRASSTRHSHATSNARYIDRYTELNNAHRAAIDIAYSTLFFFIALTSNSSSVDPAIISDAIASTHQRKRPYQRSQTFNMPRRTPESEDSAFQSVLDIDFAAAAQNRYIHTMSTVLML
jgi:hypothetical protein